jgi:MoxR-like ATPase
MITVSDLTPGQKEILEQWRTIAHENQSGATFSIEDEVKHTEIKERLPQFLDNPSEETFEAMWDTIYSAQQAGSASYVLDSMWRDEGRNVEELADFIAEVAKAEEYDETWEDTLGSIRPLREFFGWLHVDSQPIIDMQTIRGLEFFDVVDSADSLKRRSFDEQRERFADFKSVYRATVGHATENTGHELPINLEIYLLLLLIKRAGKSKLREETNEEIETFYKLVLEKRKRRDSDDSTSEEATNDDDLGQLVKSYVEAFEEGGFDEDGQYGWETWKIDYLDHFQSTIAEPFDLQNLQPEDIEPILNHINEPKVDSSNVPSKIMGYGAGWHGLKTASENDPEGAAETLSILFNEDRQLLDRLNQFEEFYGSAVEEYGSTGQVLGIASFLLMYAYSDRYIFYKWAEYRPFFERYFSYTVSQGFDPKQYVEMLDYCEAVQERLELHLDDPSMIHVHNLIWYQQHGYGQDAEIGGDAEVDYYWVNQNDPAEIEGEYLDATVDDHWSHDLSVLEVGDIVLHYTGQQVIGYSTVTEDPYAIEQDDTDRYRVEVDLERFDEPRSLDDILDYLMREEVRGEKYYPIAKDGRVTQAYLCRLTEDAADYLLNPPMESNYFWISANPSIWKVESIKDGGEAFYTAYNRKGNKRRIFGAFHEAAPGDKVLFYESQPVQAIVAEGTIVEGLHEGEHEDYDEPVKGITIEYSRPIEDITWDQLTAVPDLEETSPIVNRAQGSLFRLTVEEYETILALEEPDDNIVNEEFETLREKLEPITVDFELPDNLYFEDESNIRNEIEASLNSGKHIIFTGPPGTGKTKLAKEICRQSARDLRQVDDHTFTTATSEWTAFDTIGGYVPSTNTEESRDELTFQPRLFLNCFRREQEGIVNNWLIIDEINRSDIDKAFGQLFSVLSGDSVELPYERQNQVEIVSVDRDASDDDLRAISSNPDVFPVTPSWRLIATMNTYDKASLYEMSYAFMRRFNFVHVGIPNLETDDGTIRASLLDPDGNDNYATAWLAEDSGLKPNLEETYRELAVIWKVVNDYPRSIGPSIVRDILGYIDAYGVGDDPGQKGEALTAAIVGMVYPQLEGLRPDKQRNLVRELAGERETNRGDVPLDLNEDRLTAKAADYFDISFDDE